MGEFKKWDVYVMLALFLGVMFVWTIPARSNDMPFGDVDGAAHFTLSDAMYQSDYPLYYLPFYLNTSYHGNNEGKIWYPPQFHLNGAIFQLMGRDRIEPFFIFLAMASSAIVISVYLLMRKLFGFWPALISAILLIFSKRDIIYYILGEGPQMISHAIFPLLLLCMYYYLFSGEEEKKRIYLIVFSVLFAVQALFHPLGFLHSVVALAVLGGFYFWRLRKIPFKAKEVIIFIVVFLVVAGFFLQFPLKMSLSSRGIGVPGKGMDLSALFQWYPNADEYAMPSSFFSYSEMYGMWTLPFLIIGALFLIVRRSKRDILMLSWLLGFAIMIHLNVIGMSGRVHRSLGEEAHIFFPLVALGVYFLLGAVKVKGISRSRIRSIGSILFIALVLILQAPPALSELSQAYSGIMRVTPAQYEAAEWIMENLPEDSYVKNVGNIVYIKKKWYWALSHRTQVYGNDLMEPAPDNPYINSVTHVLLDYSDANLLGRRDVIGEIEKYESTINGSLIYDRKGIKVYEIEK